jgi:hypothetical protein
VAVVEMDVREPADAQRLVEQAYADFGRTTERSRR